MNLNLSNHLFSDQSLLLTIEQCMNYANRHGSCQKCKLVCPTTAIDLKNGLPNVHDTKCIDCGGCIGACPTMAIDHNKLPYLQTASRIKEQNQSIITCKLFEKYTKGIKIPCYLYLDLPLIILAARGKSELTFHIGECSKCIKLFDNSDLIRKHFKKLQDEIDELQISLKLNISEKVPKQDDDYVIDGITRRQFFRFLSLTHIRNSTDSKEENPLPKSMTMDFKMLWKRQTIYNELSGTISSNEQWPIFQLEIDKENCDGCPVCTAICPTGALVWEESDKRTNLLYRNEKCIGCSKCVACPKEAVSIISESTPGAEIKMETVIKNSLHQKVCTQCHELFRTHTEQEQDCKLCKAKQKKDFTRFFQG